MSKLDTESALRTAINQLQGIMVYDNNNYTKDIHNAKWILKRKLMDLITIN